MKNIDNAVMIEGRKIKTPFGYGNLWNLSTGCKTVINILENPDLPVLIFCGEEAYSGEYAYEQANASKGEIETLTLYDDMWLNEEDYRDKLSDDLCDKEEYKYLSDEEYEKMLDQKIAETEFVKAIVIWVG